MHDRPPLAGYSLWLEAGGDVFLQPMIAALAREHGTRPFHSHATLLGLLEKTESDLPALRKTCRMIAGAHHPFELQLTDIGMRDMYFQSVFLNLAPSPELDAMHREAREPFGHGGDLPFQPHWSIIYGDLDAAAKASAAKTIAAAVALPLTITIDAITLMDVRGFPDEWTVVERIRLGT